MPTPLFVTTEKRQNALPLLIVDKPGILSKGIVSVLSEHFMTVLVSHKNTLPHLTRIVHVPFRRSVPAIPDNYFSAMLLFYNGEKAIVDGMPSFLKKAKQNNAKVVLITSREHASSPFLQKSLNDYENAHLIIYGDIFGISRSEDSLVTQMVQDASVNKRITVHGTGLSESYPVYYADVLQGMLHMLLSQSPPQVGLLYPTHPVTQMHLSRLIKLLYPQAEMRFAKEGSDDKKHTMPFEGVTLLEDPYPLADKLKQLNRSRPGVLATMKKRKKKKHKPYLSFLLLTITIFVFLSLSTFIFFLIGLLNLHVAVEAGKKGELTLVKQRAETAGSLFRIADTTASVLTFAMQRVGMGEQATYYGDNVRSAKTVADVAVSMADAGITYGPIAQGKATNPEESMLTVASDLKDAILGISELQAAHNLPQTYASQLSAYKEPLQKLSGIVDVLPQLTGVGKPQVYLVLFQNNMELRPGGGFIGSYGLLTLKNGKMESFTIHDVYDADGLLTGHVEPPFALKRYLGASHLFLRDSNFSIEFSENAALAASLLEASTGDSVDGVITVDVSFLRSLLEKLGPVYLPAYDETVSAKNFYLLVQSHAEKDFFPGSTQKKDFLKYVAQALILSLQDREQLPYPQLFTAIEQALNQKHVMLTSGSPDLKTLFAKNGFTPTVLPSETEKAAAIADFIGVFDANLGVNKANYYVTRKFSHEMHLQSDGTRTGSLAVTYHNSAQAESEFGGDYKNYLQVVLPEGSQITSIKLNDQEQTLIPAVTSSRVFTSDRFVQPSGLELDQDVQFQKAIYGFPLLVPMGKDTLVTVNYQTPKPSLLPSAFSYVLRVYKQPGTDFDSYRLKFIYDPSFTLVAAPSFVSHVDNTIRASRQLSQDITIPLRFLKR